MRAVVFSASDADILAGSVLGAGVVVCVFWSMYPAPVGRPGKAKTEGPSDVEVGSSAKKGGAGDLLVARTSSAVNSGSAEARA